MERSKPSSPPKTVNNTNDPNFVNLPTVPVSSVHVPPSVSTTIPTLPVPLSLSSQRLEDLTKLGISNTVPSSLLPSNISRSIPSVGPVMGLNAFPLQASSVDNSTNNNNGIMMDNLTQKFRQQLNIPSIQPNHSSSFSPLVMNNNAKSPMNTLPAAVVSNNVVSPNNNAHNVQSRNNVEIGINNSIPITPNFLNASPVIASNSKTPVINNNSSQVRVPMGIPYPVGETMAELRHGNNNNTMYDVRNITNSGTKLEIPRTLPVPYILSSYIISINAASLELLESIIRTSLVSANIDYEYSALKWKAKCYIYKAGGSVYFTVQIFNLNKNNNNGNNGTYLLELQRLNGSHVLFVDAFQRLQQVLQNKNIVNTLDKSILDLVGTSKQQRKASIVAASNSSPTSPDTSKVASSITDFDMDPDNDPVIKRLTEQQQLNTPTVEESTAAIAAFAALSSMLTSEFDDVACPAAHSLSAMSLSQRMRTAIGTAALSGAETWRTASVEAGEHARAIPPALPTYHNMPSNMVGLSYPIPIAPPSGAVQLPAVTANSNNNTIAVAHLLERLIVRACMPCYHPAMPNNMPRASIESRTACAIALANLSLDESCCKVLGSLQVVPRLLYSSFVVPHGAASAAFRRHCLKTVMNVLKVNNDARKAAIPQMCLESIRHMPGYRDYPIGDAQFDMYCNQIDHVLTTTAGNRSMPLVTH